MDEIDKKLLKLLCKDARMSVKDLADCVYLSPPAVKSRIERLEEAGYIMGYTAKLNHSKLQYLTKAYISLEMDPKRKPEFYPFVQACPNVLECDCVTGQYSMLIKVVFKTTVELDNFIGELQRFGSTSTQIVFSTSVEPRSIELDEVD